MWINLLCDDYTGGRPDGTTYDGIAPFTRPGDLSTPNPAYFARARRHDPPAPPGTGSWCSSIRSRPAAGSRSCEATAQPRLTPTVATLGVRYERYPNIVWLNGNDFQTWSQSGGRCPGPGRRQGHPGPPIHAHCKPSSSTTSPARSLDDPRWRGIIGLDAAYTYAPTYGEVLKAYRRHDHLPVFMVEASYEGEHEYTGPSTLRRQEYWTMLSGATGQFYGNKYTWQFENGWASRLDTIGSRQMTFVTNLFSRRRWFDLVPDTRTQTRGVWVRHLLEQRRRQRQRLRHRGSHSKRPARDRLPAERSPGRRRHDEDGGPSGAGAMVRSDERKVRRLSRAHRSRAGASVRSRYLARTTTGMWTGCSC